MRLRTRGLFAGWFSVKRTSKVRRKKEHCRDVRDSRNAKAARSR